MSAMDTAGVIVTTANEVQGRTIAEYKGVVRGKYAARYRKRLRIVRLAEDVASAFADEAAVNAALRDYLRNHPAPQSPV